ncbi:MAG: MBL fold metallo-hydrolase [Steroidobacteraceae bacterium]
MELAVELADVEDVVLSHNHWDHVGGLMSLRREFAKANPRAMSRVHVGAGIFEPRLIKAQYLATGGVFIIRDGPRHRCAQARAVMPPKRDLTRPRSLPSPRAMPLWAQLFFAP